MTHAELQESLAVYRDLRGAERQEVDLHLAGCAECSSLLNAYRIMDRNLAGVRDVRPDSRLREGFYAAIGDRRAAPGAQRERAGRPRSQFVVFATATVLLVVVASAVALWQGWLPERANRIGRPFATPVPTPHSSLVGSFVWQTDGAYGYEMLRPQGWVGEGGASAWRIFMRPDSAGNAGGLALIAGNLDAGENSAQTDVMIGDLLLPRFGQDRTLEGWMANFEAWRRQSGLDIAPLRNLPDAQVFSWQVSTSPDSPEAMLLGFKVDGANRLIVYLWAGGAGLERLQGEGIVDDLVAMLASARAIPFDVKNVVPGLPGPAPIGPVPPMMTPTPLPPTDPARALPPTCAAENGSSSLLASPEDGYCFLFPARMKPSFSNAPDREVAQRLAMVGGTDPLVLSVITAPANGLSMDQWLSNVLSGWPAEIVAKVKRSETRLGGEQAVVLDGMPGQVSNRQAFVIHDGRRYQLTLSPFGDPAFVALQAEAQSLWDAVAGSWAFIAVAPTTATPPPTRTPPCDVVCQDATATARLGLRATEEAYSQRAPATGMITYYDPIIGYAVDYPYNWYGNHTAGGLITEQSFKSEELGTGNLPAGASKIELVPEPRGGFNTLEGLVAQLKKGGEGGAPRVSREETWQLAEGVPAVRMDLQFQGGKEAALVAVIHGRGLTLIGYGDLAPFDGIARSLRPVSPPALALTPPAQPQLTPAAQADWGRSQVTLDLFSGRPDPTWSLTADQTQWLREILDALPEVACAPMDQRLGYRGFVVLLGQPPELSNEYRLRAYAGQVRWGDPWSPQALATCRSDPNRSVERFLLATGTNSLTPDILSAVSVEIEGHDALPAGSK